MRGRCCLRGVILASPLLVSLAPAATAQAQAQAQGAAGQGGTQRAAALFEQAKQHLEQKKYALACPEFLRSYELDRSKVGILYALAECYADAGKVASAVARYTEYVRAVSGLPPAVRANHNDRVQRAKAQQATLTPRMPEVTLVVQGAGPGVHVALDGGELPVETLGTPRAIDPGEHRLTATSSRGVTAERSFTIDKGEKKRVEVTVLRAPAAPTAGQEASAGASPKREAILTESSGVSGRRIGAYTALGVGGAGLVVMAITGGLVFGNKSAINEACSTINDGTKGCRTQEDLDEARATQTLGVVSNIGLGVGIAGVALGAVLLLTEPAKTPNQAGARRFIAIGPTSLGPEGATVGARGAF